MKAPEHAFEESGYLVQSDNFIKQQFEISLEEMLSFAFSTLAKKCFTCFLHSDILPTVNGKFLMSAIHCLKSTLPALCCRLCLERCDVLETAGYQMVVKRLVSVK